MTKYTLPQLKHLRSIRLKGFDPKEMLDDDYTNKHQSFDYETGLFLDWLEKMEKAGKIDELLSSMDELIVITNKGMSREIAMTPYKWLKEVKFKIPQGATYNEPMINMSRYARWITEYIKTYL